MDFSQSIDRIVAAEKSVLELFYERLLEGIPDVRPLFEGIHLQTQAAMLSVALTAVRMHPNLQNSTMIYFRVLGRRHQRKGIPRDLYPRFNAILLDVIAEFHGKDWELQLASQWSDALAHVTSLMMEGYER